MTGWTRQNLAALKADKRKLSLALGLLAVLLLLWGRLLLKDIPRVATAHPSQPALPARPTPDTPPGAQTPPGVPGVEVNLPPGPPRDIFTPDLSAYPRAGNKTNVDPPAEKSEEKATDETPKGPTEGPRVTGLQLQSTTPGPDPRAVINGQELRVGQKIKGFELRKVLEHRVILWMDGIEIVLEM